MSEVQSRPSAPRGRSSARGGRSGFGSRGGRGGRSHTTNGDKTDNTPPTTIEDNGEVGQLKKLYGSKVGTIKEMFPDWTDEDAVFALQENDGDLETTVERITDGSITQWGEVSKSKKDRSRSKAKENISTTLGESTNVPRTSRGGRVGHEGARGGRGRGSERARGGRGREAGAVHTNGARAKEAPEQSVPTEESPAWDVTSKNPDGQDKADTTKPAETWKGAAAEAASSTAAAAAKITSSVIPGGVKKSWASMFKAAPAAAPKKEPIVDQKASNTSAPELIEPPSTQQHDLEAVVPQSQPELPLQSQDDTVAAPPVPQEPEGPITPSKDELTEENVEQVLDISNPPQTATQASTAASSWDPRSGAASSTPYSALQQQQRPPASGHVASALRATGGSGRTPSYQRRILDQEEAVRMPGNREVDRAAVQFGAFNLNGTGDEDVDGDREEPETRAQPPQHSPVAHPRASLPPVPTQSSELSNPVATPPGLKEGTGVPPNVHPMAAPGLPSPNNTSSAQNMSQQGSQGSQQYNQQGRYVQGGTQEQPAFGQKPYDPFNQQAPTAQSQFEGFPGQQNPSQPQPQQTQPQSAAFSSAPSEYSSYYTADQQRNAYQNYYGHQYNQQQGAQAQPDVASTSQQRSYSGYNAPQSDSTNPFPQSSAQQSQSRYATAGETQTSGHTTPNPPGQNQQPGVTTQGQQAHPSQPQGQPGQYPYGHPYYSNPYYATYANQYQQGYGQGSYAGGPYGAKGGMYNQPHQGYGISPQTPYDHTPSPAGGSFGGQSSLHGRDTALGVSLADYGRAGSQPTQNAQPLGVGGSGPFGGMQDAFSRGSSYQGQGQHYGGQQAASGDDLKPYGDGKSTNGPSPLLSQAARPGSAANSAPGQSGLPPPQSSQGGYGAYPSHLQQQQHALHGSQTSSQYVGLSGVGGHQGTGQGHQSSQYGGYGQAFGGNNYYGNNQRGGWGNNYGH